MEEIALSTIGALLLSVAIMQVAKMCEEVCETEEDDGDEA